MGADPQGLIGMHAAIACDELETWANDLGDYLDSAGRTATADEMVRWYPGQQQLLRATRGMLFDVVGRLRAEVVARLDAEGTD